MNKYDFSDAVNPLDQQTDFSNAINPFAEPVQEEEPGFFARRGSDVKSGYHNLRQAVSADKARASSSQMTRLNIIDSLPEISEESVIDHFKSNEIPFTDFELQYARSNPDVRENLRNVYSDKISESISTLAQHALAGQSIKKTGARKAFDEAEGLGEAFEVLKNDPLEVASSLTTESLVQFAPALPFLFTGPAGASAAGALTSGLNEFGGDLVASLSEAGIDVTHPAAIREAFSDPETVAEWTKHATKRSVPIAVIDGLSAGLGGVLVNAAKTPLKKAGAVAAESLVLQPALGASGEVAGTLSAGDEIEGKAVLAEAIGEILPGAAETAGGVVSARMRAAGERIREQGGDELDVAMAEADVLSEVNPQDALTTITPEAFSSPENMVYPTQFEAPGTVNFKQVPIDPIDQPQGIEELIAQHSQVSPEEFIDFVMPEDFDRAALSIETQIKEFESGLPKESVSLPEESQNIPEIVDIDQNAADIVQDDTALAPDQAAESVSSEIEINVPETTKEPSAPLEAVEVDRELSPQESNEDSVIAENQELPESTSDIVEESASTPVGEEQRNSALKTFAEYARKPLKEETGTPEETRINEIRSEPDTRMLKKGVQIAIDKQLKGEPLTDKQQLVINKLVGGSQVEQIDQAANEAATSPLNNLPEPTEAQKEANNYKVGKVKIHGLDISIENPKGSKRKGVDADGNAWESDMAHHYGDIKRSKGADGDNVDVFVGENPESDKVFIVDQVNKDGSFDEHKTLVGFDSEQEAVDGYLANYEDGWTVGPVSELSVDEFKGWIKDGDTTKAYSVEGQNLPQANDQDTQSAETEESSETQAEKTTEPKTEDKPLAAEGLDSYRYKGRYGYVMIGAKNQTNALSEANRSLSTEKADKSKLEKWDGKKYVLVSDSTNSNKRVEYKKKTNDKEVKFRREENLDLSETVNKDSFKEWFSDSKVVDGNGEPLVVYHGGLGASSITEFSSDYGGQNTGNNEHGAFHFTDVKDVADDYGRQSFIRKYQDYPEGLVDDEIATQEEVDQHEEDGDVNEWVEFLAEERIERQDVFLSIQNPYEIDMENERVNVQQIEEYTQAFMAMRDGDFSKVPDEAMDKVMEMGVYDPSDVFDYRDEINTRVIEDNDLDSLDEAEDWQIEDSTNKILQENGIEKEYPIFDGIIIRNMIDDIGEMSQQIADQFIVFDPEKIKSVNNEGNFSSFNSNIYYSKSKANQKSKTKKAKNQAPARRLNKVMANTFGDDWKNAYESVVMPKEAAGLEEAVKTAFGTSVRPVQHTEDKFNTFSGLYLTNGSNVYVNVRAGVGFMNIAGHELMHDMKQKRPDLYDWFSEQAQDHIKDFAGYKDGLMGRIEEGESDYSDSDVMEELLADFAGDALADPAFVEKLAKDNPGKFKKLMNFVIGWLKKVGNKIKDLGSKEYFNEVNDLREKLRQALNDYAEGKPISPNNPPEKEVVFSSLEEDNGKGTTGYERAKAKGLDMSKSARMKRAEEMGFDTDKTYYHGTNNQFDVFNEDQYFTNDPNYSNLYTSNKSRTGDDTGGNVIPVYLSKEGAFDTRIPEHRKIFEEEFFMKYGNGTPLSESGLPDWVEGRDLAEFFKEDFTDHNFDSVLLDEAADTSGKRPDSRLVFNPSKIRSVNAAFDPEESDSRNIMFSHARESSNTPIREGVRDRMDAFRFQMQDKLIDLKRAQEGLELEDEANPYQKAAIWEGKAGEQLNDFDEGKVQPLLEKVAETDMTLTEVGEWLVARHAKEANAYLAEINPDKPASERNRLSGMSNIEAGRILSKHSDNSSLQEVGAMVDGINRDRAALLVSEGLETQDVIDAWQSRYEHYVPLKREEAEGAEHLPSRGQGFQIKGRESKMRTGAAYWNPVHIISNTIAQAESSIVRAEKNRVGESLLNFVEQNPDDNFWSIDRERKTKSVRDGKVVEGVKLWDAPNEMTVKRNGEEYVIVFNPNNERAMRLVTGMKNLQAGQMGAVMRGLATVTRFLATVNTSWNPEFMVSNFFRDIQTAAYNLSDTELQNMKTRVIKDVPKAMGGIRSALFGDGSSEWADQWEDFRQNGGKTGWLDLHADVLAKEKDLEKMVDRLKNGKPTKSAISRFLTSVEGLNNVIENGVRLSAYKNAVDAGLSKEKAAALAKDLTVNFNRKGNLGPQINALYMFYNAAIQGSVRLLQAMATSKQGRNMAMATIGGAVMLDIVNRAISGDDDDGENIYDELPDFVKNHNIIIMGEKEPIIKIPAPWGYNVLHTIGQTIGEAATGERFNALDSGARVATSMIDAFNPVGSSTIMQTLSPTVFDPVAQIAENKSFSGLPLKPEHTFDASRPKPEYLMHFSSVRESSKAVAKMLNDVSGGNEQRPGDINVSPEWIDLIIDNATGGLGKTVANTADVVNRMIQGKEIPTENTPFLRRVTGFNNEYGVKSRYYEWSRDVAYAKYERKNLRGDDRKKAMQKPQQKLIALYGSTEKQLSSLRKARKTMEKNGASKEVIEKMDSRIRKVMSRFNEAYAKRMFSEPE